MQTSSYFVNNYFNIGLKAWLANMDIQLVFNEYKSVTYMCSLYFFKTEDQCSQVLILHIFSRDLILTIMWKEEHYAMQNTEF